MLKLAFSFLGLLFIYFGEMLSGRRKIKLVFTETNLIYGIRILGNKTYIYVGKTDIANFERRKSSHIRKSFSRTHVNKRLSTAIRSAKFAVTFDVLCYCNEDNVFEKEAYYINKLKTNRMCNIIIPKSNQRSS